MKVLIMVQATKDKPYDELIKAQKRTWDSVEHPDVETVYYYSGKKYREHGKNLYVKCSNNHDLSHYRFKLALDWIYDSNDAGYDYIFRTNASSYVDKARLVEWLKDKPRTNFYCGIDGGGFASGCGFAMSTDLVNVLRTMDDHPSPSEDCTIGLTLEKSGQKVTPGAERYDYYFAPKSEIPKIYHYRCKSDTEDRNKDIQAFEFLYNYLNG